jgi:molybdopterin-containing oxidoreductase family membrane subunit
MALFPNSKQLLEAAVELKQKGVPDFTMISPVPMEELEEALGEQKSPVKYFSFIGGVVGAISGFSLAAGTAVMYQIPVGGRAIIALPPFLLITYEMTILFGVLLTVFGFFVSCRFPVLEERPYLPEATVDQFMLVLDQGHGNLPQGEVDEIFRSAGADEIRDLEVKAS